MTEHTPGPWRRGTCEQSVVADSTIGTHHTAGEIDFYGGALVCESVVTEANLDLIAAAPDLLAALEFIAEGFDNQDISHLDYRIKAAEAALAAIAKAKGATSRFEGRAP